MDNKKVDEFELALSEFVKRGIPKRRNRRRGGSSASGCAGAFGCNQGFALDTRFVSFPIQDL